MPPLTTFLHTIFKTHYMSIEENTKTGFIPLFRSMQKHWLHDNALFFRAWCDILFTVNHSEKKINLGNDIFIVKRGESLHSLDSWARIFGNDWNKSKVRRFFKLLEKDSMIETKNEQKTTRLTVCNYVSYNDWRNADETQVKRDRNTDETQTTSNNNDNKENNKKNNYKKLLLSEIEISDLPKDYDLYLKIARANQSHIKNYLLESGLSTEMIDKAKGAWINSARLMIEQDKRTVEQIKAVFSFLKTSTFWRKNIMSMDKFRAKFERLYLESKNDTSKQNGFSQPQQTTISPL